jgi:very-short-patch-repair endonuclease
MVCKFCGKDSKNNGASTLHQKTCGYVSEIKEEIKKLYVDDLWSIKRIKDKYNLGSQTICNMLGDNLRTRSESSKISHQLFPEKFKHSDETKQKIREHRLLFMKENPDQTSWRTKNLSYPEKLFLEKVYELSLDKKFSIVREYPIFPYFIDFAFVNEKVAVEIDGSQHLLIERKNRDNKKDDLLIQNGWFVIRVSENEIKTNINLVFDTINSVMSDRPKTQSMKIGVVKFPKKRQKKNRESCGLTAREIERCINQRRVDRPPYEELVDLVKNNGYTKTANMFGVSDNSIRKWIKFYEKSL